MRTYTLFFCCIINKTQLHKSTVSVLNKSFSLEQQWWYIEFCNFVRCDSDNNNNSNNGQHLRVADMVMDLGRVVDVVMVSLQGSLEDHLALVSATTSADMSKQSKHMYFTKEDE
jgi:hypothetical protein